MSATHSPIAHVSGASSAKLHVNFRLLSAPRGHKWQHCSVNAASSSAVHGSIDQGVCFRRGAFETPMSHYSLIKTALPLFNPSLLCQARRCKSNDAAALGGRKCHRRVLSALS